MNQIIARLTGVITSAVHQSPAKDLMSKNYEKYCKLKDENKLPLDYYQYSVDQHTGESIPFQFKVKDYDLTQPIMLAFSDFDQICTLSSWSFNDRHGISVKPSKLSVKKISMQFDESEKSKKAS